MAAKQQDPIHAQLAAHFPRLSRDRIYINAAGRTPLPLRSLSVGLEAVRKKAETPWDIGSTDDDRDAIRALFAGMIGAEPRDVCTAPSTSYAIMLAANNLRCRLTGERSRVLVLEDQMSSHVLPWQEACAHAGDGSLLVVQRPADFDWTREVLREIEGGTVAICAVPPCHWCDGSVLDLEAIGAACAARDVALVVDATQWLGGGGALDVRRIGATFVACSVHKWLLGPYGVALCYAREDFWRTAAPLEHHDRNREGAQHVECLPMGPGGEGYPTAFQPGALRLDSGGRPSFILMPMLLASLELLASTPQAELADAVGGFTRELAARARALGFRVPVRHAPCIVGLWPDPRAMPSAEAIVAALAARKPRPVVVGARFGAIRVSPHAYNTRADLEVLLRGLADAVAPPAELPPHAHAAAAVTPAEGGDFRRAEIGAEEQMRRLWRPQKSQL